MENLFDLTLNPQWVNKGVIYNILTCPRITVKTFAEAFAVMYMSFRVENLEGLFCHRNDTEVFTDEQVGQVETKTIIPIENLGDNLENLFNIINDILQSFHPFSNNNNQEKKDYE